MSYKKIIIQNITSVHSTFFASPKSARLFNARRIARVQLVYRSSHCPVVNVRRVVSGRTPVAYRYLLGRLNWNQTVLLYTMNI